MPSSSGHGNLQQIASYPADSTAIRNLNNNFPSERFYTAHSESTSLDIRRREKIRLQRQGTGEISVSSDILNVGARVSTVMESGSARGGGRGSPPPNLLNGGGADLLASGVNAPSSNVAAKGKTSLCDQGKYIFVVTTLIFYYIASQVNAGYPLSKFSIRSQKL
jgi:hypothetical protein